MLVNIKTSDIKPYYNNPRKNDDAVVKVAESIKAFGFRNPILLDGDNIIIAGHTRWKAALLLKQEEVPCIIYDDMPEDKVKAYRIADNRIGEFAEWDWEALKNEMDGFDKDLIDLLDFDIPESEEIGGGLTDEDDVPEVKDSICKPGDLWKLGEHRLLCGDATISTDVEKLMDGAKADMVFTDPPYGLGGYGGRNNMALLGDDLDVAPFYKAIPKARETYVWGRVYNLIDINFEPRDIIVWRKNNFGLGRGYRGQYEVCFYGGEFSGSDSDVWDVAKDTDYKHPTQKPVELALRAIKNSDPINVVDLFCGSGSTLIACEKTNRKCYGMELDPHYCDVIVKRWEDYTGNKAELING